MKCRKLLTSSLIILISGLGLVGKAEALLWKGFSELCFEGEWKGGSVKEGLFTATLSQAEIMVNCYNTQAGESCQPGGGNAGDITVTEPASADPTKAKGTITTSGCIDLAKFDTHSAPDHVHMCSPVNNINKVEHEGTARILKIKVNWELTKNDGQIQRRGIQECYWPGYFDSTSCTPEHDVIFDCPIDEEYRK